jgi:hypothetical protein
MYVVFILIALQHIYLTHNIPGVSPISLVYTVQTIYFLQTVHKPLWFYERLYLLKILAFIFLTYLE